MVTDTAYQRITRALKARRLRVTDSSAQCPAHDDSNASLSVTRTNGKALLHCHAGCATADVLAELDLTMADLNDEPREPQPTDTWMPCGHTKVAEYHYRDRDGTLEFAVARCDRKGNGCQGFRQWRPDPTSRSGKRWSRNLPDGTRVGEGLPYRLPEILALPAGDIVYVVEGEKDADRLWTLGVPATCNAQGAGKWTQTHADWLTGHHIIVVADHDRPGYRHAEHVVHTLMNRAASISVALPASGKDISDHLNTGLHLDQLTPVAHPKAAQ